MTEHHVTVDGGPVTDSSQMDSIHQAVETEAGERINTSMVEMNVATGEATIHLWLDADDAATAETVAKVIVRIARNGGQ